MATTEELLYSIQSKAQLAAINAAIDAIGDMSDAVDDMGDEVSDSNKKIDDLNDDLKETISFGGKMKGALGGIGGIAGKIGLGIGGIAGAIGGAMALTQDWALNVEQLSSQFSIGLDQASAMAVSWERAGLSAEEGASIFSGLQGRLISELEAQKEASKELANIQKERAGIVEEMAEAEADFHATIADLEAERAELDSSNIEKRRQSAAKEIEDLKSDYTQFIKDQEEAEREETATFEKIWEERARKFEESSEKLRDKFSDDARKARNFREFSEAAKNFQEQRKQLVDNLNKDNQEQENSHEKRVRDREEANERERQLMEQRSADIATKADEDVAKMEEANQKALANLDARIADEKAAYADRTESFQEGLAEMDAAAAATASAGGDLTFVMEELGVKVFDSEGNMRDFSDIIWDTQEAINNMEEGGRKAALIADLGLEDASVWLNRGIGEVDALREAREKNLVVTTESLEAIHRQREALADARLSALGFANSLGVTEKVNAALVSGMESTAQAVVIAQGLWTQLKEIVGLLWDKFLASLDTAKENLEQLSDIATLGFDKIKEATGFGEEGFFTQAGDLLGFRQGTKSVGGVEPQLAVVHPGEEIRTSADVTANGPSMNGGGGLTVNINAPVYGIQDLNNAIQGAVRQYDQGAFSAV
jgi:predicted  nucleic acid-binding Zn-ribbon protein